MLSHVGLMVSVGLNYILRVALKLGAFQRVQRSALSLTFSARTLERHIRSQFLLTWPGLFSARCLNLHGGAGENTLQTDRWRRQNLTSGLWPVSGSSCVRAGSLLLSRDTLSFPGLLLNLHHIIFITPHRVTGDILTSWVGVLLCEL